MKKLSIILSIILFVGCASVSVIEDTVTKLSYILVAEDLIDRGECIPDEIKTDVIPAIEAIIDLLESDDYSAQDIITLLNGISIKYVDDPLLSILLIDGIALLVNQIKALGYLEAPLKGERLHIVVRYLELNLKGLKEVVRVADYFKAWCSDQTVYIP